MKDLHRLTFDYADGRGMDFKPYTDFHSKEETRESRAGQLRTPCIGRLCTFTPARHDTVSVGHRSVSAV